MTYRPFEILRSKLPESNIFPAPFWVNWKWTSATWHIHISDTVFVFFAVQKRGERRVFAVGTCDQSAACNCSHSTADLECHWLFCRAVTWRGEKAPVSSSVTLSALISPSLLLFCRFIFRSPSLISVLFTQDFLYLPLPFPFFSPVPSISLAIRKATFLCHRCIYVLENAWTSGFKVFR